MYSSPIFVNDYLPYLANTPPAADGAIGDNATLEAAGETSTYNAAIQSNGAELVIRGAVDGDRTLVDAGLSAFDWAFAKQTPDGGIPVGTPGDINVTHAIIDDMFLAEGVARSLLVLTQSSLYPQYADRIAATKGRLGALVAWMTTGGWWDQYLRTAQAETVGNGSRGPLAHRFYIAAAAMAETGALLGQPDLVTRADSLIADGLAVENPSGFNPEGGGYDTSYEMVGVTKAEYWLAAFPGDSHATAVAKMINGGVQWESSRIEPDGRINWTGNTRSCTPYELDGTRMKNPGYVEAQLAFAWWSQVSDHPDLLTIAGELRTFIDSADQNSRVAPCW